MSGFFSSESDVDNLTSGSEQGTQSREDAVSSNINLTAGDDQSANISIDDSLTQIDNSDNSTVTDSYNTATDSYNTSQVDNSVNTTTTDSYNTTNQYDYSSTDNSVTTNQVDESSNISDSYNTSSTTTNQYDQSQTTITYTDAGAIAGAVTIAQSSIDALNQQTAGLFSTVDDIVEGYGAMSDSALTTIAGSFESSLDQISEDAQSQTESVLQDTFKFLGAVAAIAGAVLIFR